MAGDNETELTGLALVEAAEAQAAEAEAVAEAAKARARAVRLRHAFSESDALACGADSDAGTEDEPDTDTVTRRKLRRPGARTVAIGAAVVVLLALLAGTGLLAWHHYRVERDQQRAAQFIAVARQGVVNMTTLDSSQAESDVARVLDSATGDFKRDFASRISDFTSMVKDSKMVTSGTVTAAAVESMNEDSAVVLVSAVSTVTEAGGAKQPPRNWRLSVTVAKDSGRLKLSKVVFAA
jgi:Mce-associated membrane protein